MAKQSSRIRAETRLFHAQMMAAVSGSLDGRLARIFELVPREAFLGPGPWQICVPSGNGRSRRRYIQTPSADPVHINQNVLVALDAQKGIHNGEPYLHAAWIGSANPVGGEIVSHVGAGTGYYTAILSMLTLPKGHVHAFEIDETLARLAQQNLTPFDGVSVTHGDATVLPLPPSDLIYVNAGVAVPPVSWLRALRPGGRLIFPWRPTEDVALAMLVTKTREGFSVQPLRPAWFIPCVGASDAGEAQKLPSLPEARSIRSLWLKQDHEPDDTAVAIFNEVWFSSQTISQMAAAA
jgi:protein-L-isoaspartate(D-aspartate) O-methyltransferase